MSRHPKAKSPGGKPLSVIWTDRALADLEAIGHYIALDNPGAAGRWISEIGSLVERAASFPLAGRIVPEVGRPEIRELLKRTYRIVYRLGNRQLEVLTVFEGHRLLPEQL